MLHETVGLGGNGMADTDLADRVKTWAGLALAAFLAAINLIGLNNGEIPNILRNNIVAADVTGLLILAAAMTAVIGALLPARTPLPVLWLAPIFLATAAVVLLPWVFIQIPTQGDYSQGLAFWSGSLGIAAFIALGAATYWYYPRYELWTLSLPPNILLAGAAACGIASVIQRLSPEGDRGGYLIWAIIFLAGVVIAQASAGAVARIRDRPNSGSWFRTFSPDGRSVLLVLALVLTTVAMVGALRAEARSQDQSTAPKVDSTLTLSSTGTGGVYSLTVNASAAHLPGSNVVEVTVYGLPHPVNSAATATATDSSLYQKAPWRHPPRCQTDGCRLIANSFYGPDSQGSLDVQVDVLFLRKSYDSIRIVARRFSPSAPCLTGNERQCYTVTSLIVPMPN